MTITTKCGRAWATQRKTLPSQWNLYVERCGHAVGVIHTKKKSLVRKIVALLAEDA